MSVNRFKLVFPAQPIWTQQIALTSFAMMLIAAGLAFFPHASSGQSILDHQPAEVGPRNPNRFGFPYPPPSPDEPGVTLRRRYMLDGVPHFNFRPRPQDEIWLISTRKIQSPDEMADRKFRAKLQNENSSGGQLECFRIVNQQWQTADIGNLFACHTSNQTLNTFVFVHGNRTTEFWSQRRGKQVYQALFGNVQNSPPVRFVIWSWPSERLWNPIDDFEVKMRRALFEGQLFSSFLGRLDSKHPVALMGYSMGAQVIFTALANLPDGSEILADPSPQNKYRLSVVAPVNDCRWPVAESEAIKTAQHIDSLMVFRNPGDRAIKAYQLYCRTQVFGPCRTNIRGIEALRLDSGRYCEFDVSSEVGNEHNMIGYVQSTIIQANSRRLVELR